MALKIFRSIDLDESEEEVKATSARLCWVYVHNNSAADRFVKFYDATAAATVVGTTTPKMTIPLEAGAGAVFDISAAGGLQFASGLTVAATTGIADADTGAPGANDVIINIGYE